MPLDGCRYLPGYGCSGLVVRRRTRVTAHGSPVCCPADAYLRTAAVTRTATCRLVTHPVRAWFDANWLPTPAGYRFTALPRFLRILRGYLVPHHYAVAAGLVLVADPPAGLYARGAIPPHGLALPILPAVPPRLRPCRCTGSGLVAVDGNPLRFILRFRRIYRGSALPRLPHAHTTHACTRLRRRPLRRAFGLRLHTFGLRFCHAHGTAHAVALRIHTRALRADFTG